MDIRRSTAVLLFLACAATPLAAAQEYCVVCFSPEAKYRCILEAQPGATGLTARGELVCITELARTGQHASCAVGRINVETCDGPVRTVMIPDTETNVMPPSEWQPELIPPEDARPVLAAEPAPDEPQSLPEEGPPQTVEELAKQTVEASGKGLKKAGEAVSDTAQSAGEVVTKTWTCLSSLFSDC